MEHRADDEAIVVTRHLDLDVPLDELWQLVADGDRWAEWLAEEAQVVVGPEHGGTVVDDDGVERQVAIESVVPGDRVRFAWWPTDRPGDASTVELVVAPAPWLDRDRSRLTVIETYASATSATARATASRAWDLRLMLLVLCLDAVALVRR